MLMPSVNSGSFDATHRIIPLVYGNINGDYKNNWDIIINGNGIPVYK